MMEKYYILIAEGVTDCSLLEAMLEKCLGFVQYQKVSQFRDQRRTDPKGVSGLVYESG